MALGFFFDNSRCTGCRTCAMACADFNDLGIGRKYRRIIDFEGGTTRLNENGRLETSAFSYHISLACNHCNQPECMHVCPTGAMHKDDLGLVCVDTNICIGCGYCTIACPYHAPSIDPQLKQSSKCNGCSQRVSEGLNPICVDACPLRALDFGEIPELQARHQDCVLTIQPLPEPTCTSPNLVIKPSVRAAITKPGEGWISDEYAIRNNYPSVSVE